MADQSLRLTASLDALEQAQAFVASRAEAAGLDRALIDRLAIALEEVFVNICHYAYPDGVAGPVELHARAEGDRFVLEVVDQGDPFDGLSLPDPDIAASLDERPIGGLGWYLARRLVSELQYRRDGQCNLVRFIMEMPADGARTGRSAPER